jgi:antitoxin YobK
VLPTDFNEFELLIDRVRAEQQARTLPDDFQVFDSWKASEAQIVNAEEALGVQLPPKYTQFMTLYGGGVFKFVELLPIVSPSPKDENLVAVNEEGFREAGFIAIAPVGSGDWWGFTVYGGRCGDTVDFWDHEDGSIEISTMDFLEFLVRKGLGLPLSKEFRS